MNEALGIVTDLLRKRMKYGRYAYRAPAIPEPEVASTPEPDLEGLVRAAVANYMGSDSGRRSIERAVTSALTEEASRWRQNRLSKADIASAVLHHPIDKVLAIAADITGISVEVMRRPDRRRSVAWPRHFAISLLHCARRDLSTSQIGKVFGGQDHTTILHALQKCTVRKMYPECEAWFLDPRAVEIFAGTEYALNGSAETEGAGRP